VIADKFPEANLLPIFGSRERYTALEWLNFVATDLHKGMAVMFSPLIDRSSKTKFADGNLTSKFEYVDTHLSNKQYILGDQFSVADAYLYNVLSWTPRVNLDLSKYDHIQAFMKRLGQRSTVQESIEGEGLRFRG
jgi:glutathione S-transferase